MLENAVEINVGDHALMMAAACATVRASSIFTMPAGVMFGSFKGPPCTSITATIIAVAMNERKNSVLNFKACR